MHEKLKILPTKYWNKKVISLPRKQENIQTLLATDKDIETSEKIEEMRKRHHSTRILKRILKNLQITKITQSKLTT